MNIKYKNKYFKKIDLWPISSSQPFIFRKNKNYTIEEFENYLRKIYGYKAYPLFVSSARNAINICLQSLDYNKTSNINLFPYASKCIRNKINKITNISNSENIRSITHHYCGIVNTSRRNNTIIEDSVDTLMSVEGNFFKSNGIYEIWSLNKIFGSIGGAIIWCKEKEYFEKTKNIRDSFTKYKNLNIIFKLLFYKQPAIYQFYMSNEINSYASPDWSSSYYKSYFDNINQIISSRKKNLNLFKDIVSPNFINDTRFPSIIAIDNSKLIVKILEKYDFMYKHRHIEIEKNENKQLLKILPIPIHQQVSYEELRRLKEYIDGL